MTPKVSPLSNRGGLSVANTSRWVSDRSRILKECPSTGHTLLLGHCSRPFWIFAFIRDLKTKAISGEKL